MKNCLLILFLLFFSISCTQNSKIKDKQNKNEDEEFTEIVKFEDYDISMLRLIVTPEKYHNKTVQIIGYLNLEFEGNAIYFHKEDYENGSSRNGMWVSFNDELEKKKDLKKYNKKYVIIVGKFNMNSKGHMGMFGGSLKNITRLDEWK
ncbi:hypothetical protein [Chryseobacterium sp. R2A-55]|uniref:hypothetical protein n=1 Tax=Chryseobacterium sp. R2A-55 TaxID=2744445 RepID=UPI001F2406A7|nr:hypothetical protein [Chryseobacterium sp. R2A-55]